MAPLRDKIVRLIGRPSGRDHAIVTIPDFLRHLMRTAPGSMMSAFFFLWIASLTEGVSVLLLVPILKFLGPSTGHITIHTPGWAGGHQIILGLGLILTIFVITISARAWLMRKKDLTNADFLYDYTNGLRIRLFEAVARSRWAFLAQLRGSDINHALTADTDRVISAVSQFLQIVQTAAFLVIYFVVALFISPVLTLLCAAIGALIVVGLSPLRRMALRYGYGLTVRRRDQYRIVSEFVSGLKLAKASNAEQLFVSELSATLSATRDGALKFVRLYSLGGAFFQIATAVGLSIFVYFAVVQFAMQPSAILALVVVFSRVAPRIGGIHGAMQDVLTNLPALNAIIELQRKCVENREVSDRCAIQGPVLRSSIEFRAVGFAFYKTDGRRILDDVSFVIPAGKITALVGPSGSGKSTIADLLMGLLECDSGGIYIDGVQLDASTRRSWRDALAYVPQDSFMLHESVRENLLFGGGAADEATMWEALQLANAGGFVRALPNGLDTVVGDRGLKVSGGERQRIAIARALLRTPTLLVLDEATSALDWENQAIIASVIERLRGVVTVLTIAHRPSMIASADWVVAIDGGVVVETGMYRDLADDPRSYLSAILTGDR